MKNIFTMATKKKSTAKIDKKSVYSIIKEELGIREQDGFNMQQSPLPQGQQAPISQMPIAMPTGQFEEMSYPETSDKKKYEIILREGDLVYPPVHGFVFKLKEFYGMLVNKEFNVGKEAVKKHIILSGAEDYYKILYEAIKHGFTN
jgi:hypothetical protein